MARICVARGHDEFVAEEEGFGAATDDNEADVADLILDVAIQLEVKVIVLILPVLPYLLLFFHLILILLNLWNLLYPLLVWP